MIKPRLILTKISFCCILLLFILSQKAISVEVLSSHSTATNNSLSLESFFTLTHTNYLSSHNLGSSSASYTFSGAIADTINYIQLCKGTTNTCSTCNAPFLTIIGGSVPYATSGTTYTINQSSLAAYLTQAGLSAGTYNIGMYVQSTSSSNCSSGYCGTKVDNSATPLCMVATFDGSNVTNITQQDNGNAILNTAKYQSIYVGDNATDIYQCTASNSNGSISASSCTSESAFIHFFGIPYGIAFATVNNVQYAYVANEADFVYKCVIDSGASGGDLTGCSSTGDTNIAKPSAVAVNTAKNQTQYGYIGDLGNADIGAPPGVYQCSIDSIGDFYPCNYIMDTLQPLEFAFATLSNNSQYVYMAATINGSNAEIESCSYSSSGTFTSCAAVAPSGVGSWVPNGVAVAKINGTLYAYINDIGNSGTVWKCPIASDGNLPACTQQTAYNAVGTMPTGITVALVNGVNYAYVTDGSNGGLVYACSINNSTGNFTSCTSGTYVSSGTPFPTAAVASTYY